MCNNNPKMCDLLIPPNAPTYIKNGKGFDLSFDLK